MEQSTGTSWAPTVSFPPSLPQVTAVGGTSLALGEGNTRIFETGWESSFSFLLPDTCSQPWTPWGAAGLVETCEGDAGASTTGPMQWSPSAPGGYYGGAGGGVSSLYTQPGYQKGVIPRSIAGSRSPMRALPDVAMLADWFSGILVGATFDGTQ